MQIREKAAISSDKVTAKVQPGDLIDGKYQIEAELGQGGMGRVLAATHVTLGSTVAIKLLKTEALKFPEVPRRFLREARSASRLRSEHVVRVSDIGQLPTGEPYMVMEMLHGIDLAAMIEQGAVPPGAAVEYIAQACQGLAEAHALGMVHRDIKPANLFVTRRPNGAPLVKVLDFGIATAAAGDVDHNLTTTLTVIGSPSYMSPEQLRAARDVDPRSDIWSLGVTLYELLSGEQPFVAPTLTALTLKIVSEPHTPLRNVPRELTAIVERCLAKEREDRFANVAELAAALAPLFPNGRVHAEMVAGSLSGAVPPTLHGIESSAAISAAAAAAGSAATAYSAGPSPPTTTTDLSAGESAPMRQRPRRRRALWIGVGAAMAGAIVTAGIMLSQRRASIAAPTPAVAPPPDVAAPAPAPAPGPGPVPMVTPIEPAPAPAPPPEPPPAPAPETAPPVPAPAPVTETAPPPPVKRPVKPPVKRPPAKPEVKPPRDPRTPVEPPDYTKPPVKDPPKEPSKEPVKKPCAPNDPTCGL